MATKRQTAKKTAERPQEETVAETATAAIAATGPVCTVPGCDRPVFVRGLCADHWADPKA